MQDKEFELLTQNKQLLDKIHKLELDIKDLEYTNKKLIKINRKKELSILEALSSLSFYANSNNYDDYEEFGEPSSVEVDNGKRARKSIGFIKNKP